LSLETSDKFRRQRTRLLIISILLSFYHMMRLQVKHLDVFGIQIEIGSPDRVTLILWLGWLYWLWRYWSHYADIEDRGIQSTYVGKLATYARLEAAKRFAKEPPPTTVTIRGRSTIESAVRWNPTPSLLLNYTGIPRSFTVRFFGDCTDNMGGTVQQEHSIQVQVRWFHKLGALWDLLFRKPHGSEYFLPFLVAVLPVLIWAAQWIAATALRNSSCLRRSLS
jgi:hypothetical protein